MRMNVLSVALFALFATSAHADDSKFYGASAACHTSGGSASRSSTGLSNSSSSSTLTTYCLVLNDEGDMDEADSWFLATDLSSTSSVSCTLRENGYAAGAITTSSVTKSTSGYSTTPMLISFSGTVDADDYSSRILVCTIPAVSVGTSILHSFGVDEDT